MKTDRKEIFRETFESTFTYIEGFMRNVRRYGDRPAVFSPARGIRLTYSELNSAVNQLAGALQRSGLGKGDTLMYMLHNSIEFILCYLAPQKIGVVNCPVNYYLSAGELALNIEDSRPRVFVYEDAFADTVEAAFRLSSYRPEIVLSVGGTAPEGQLGFDGYLSGGSEAEPQPAEPLNIYDECTRLYTSGTTSRPKGVPLYSINEVLSAHDVIMHFPLSPSDRTMNMTPWFHRGGLHSGGPCPTLYAGGEVVILREFNAGLTLQYTQDYGITFLVGVPAVLSLLCRVQEQTHADLGSLKGIVTMGAPLDRERGSIPMSIASAVMMIGRRRAPAADMAAEAIVMPSRRRSEAYSVSSMAVFASRPISMISPTCMYMLFSRPNTLAKRNEPKRPNGTDNITAKGMNRLS